MDKYVAVNINIIIDIDLDGNRIRVFLFKNNDYHSKKRRMAYGTDGEKMMIDLFKNSIIKRRWRDGE